MHRSLQIAEVLQQILLCCYQVGVDGNSRLDEHTLLAAALTCRSFRDPALDILWRETEIVELSGCFPEHMEAEDDLAKPEHWTRALFYSRRIRTLSIAVSGTAKVDKVLEILAHYPLDDYFFPHLETLSLAEHHTADALSCLHLLPLHLSTFRIVLPSAPIVHIFTLFALLPRLYPSLRALEFENNYAEFNSDIFAPAVSRLVRALPHLRVFAGRSPWPLACMTLQAATHLAMLPHLTKLALRLNFNGGTLESLPTSAFPALTHLEAHGRAELLTELLRLVSSPHLESVRFIILNAVLPENFRECDALLAAPALHPAALRITDLRILCLPACVKYALTPARVRPLLALRGIEHLRLEFLAPPAIGDAFMGELARAWPRLRSLVFVSHEPGWTLQHKWLPRMTLGALNTLAVYCPRLEHARLFVDATRLLESISTPSVRSILSTGTVTETDAVAAELPMSMHFSALISINFSLSPIGDPHAVAAYLVALLPMLYHVEGFGKPVAAWAEVERLMANMRRSGREGVTV